MFKKIKNKIRQYLQNQAKKRQTELRNRYYEIRGAVIKFYEDKDLADGGVNIPAFKRADDKLKEVIKTDKDVDFYYKKLLKYRATTRYSY